MIAPPANLDLAINNESIALIEEHIRHLLQAMNFSEAKVSCACRAGKNEVDKPYLHVAIDARASGRLLIGVRGSHLNAFQHIVRATLRRHLDQPIRIVVDINGYVAARERTLLHLAEAAARQAGRTGQAVTLPPMIASERHTVHTILSSRQDINTSSLGQEPNRRVVVSPIFI